MPLTKTSQSVKLFPMIKHIRLYMFLKQHQIRQYELAEAIGLRSPSAVSLKLSGKRPWTQEQIDKALELFRKHEPDVRYSDLWDVA